ncbi:MAG TPA: hypothetical protein DCW90_05240 [Lachnospiraceae bacterium]|nr:hypothetical protein [Lachnospiraceae bacterium]
MEIAKSSLKNEKDSKDSQVWITTMDNPFDPFTDFDNWYRFDESKGYCTSGLIARFSGDTEDFDLSDADYYDQLDKSIDRALATDVEGLYFKIKRVDGITIPKIRAK